MPVSYTHLRAHETSLHLVCRLLLEKKNLQARAEVSAPIVRAIHEKLNANKIFLAAVQPKRITGTMINRYDQGMFYGKHNDAPEMNGIRTDFSFTLFLSPPEDYDGGELVIYADCEASKIKLPAGKMVLYPTRFVHEVTEVTRGTRIAAVGWVES